VLAPLVALTAMEAAGLATVNRSLGDARQLRSASSYSDAVAEYDAISKRSGIVYVLAHSRIDGAAVEAQRTLLEWAQTLAAGGQVDQALEMTARVTDPTLLADAQRAAAQFALDDARRQAAAGHADIALTRLDLIGAGNAPADLVAQADALRPQYSLDGARAFLAAGSSQQAVDALDAVLTLSPIGALADAARSLLPQALLGAARAAIDAHDQPVALVPLQRLVDRFAATPQAATARQLLAAPQPVTGTLVHRDGTAAGGVRVRLGSDYRRVGTGFLTSPPYYYARTDAQGAFAFTGVPVGAKVTLEILDGGQWTVLETDAAGPSTQRPLYQVAVTPLTPVDLAFVRLPA
jgi:hypothetical protein